MSPFCAYYLCEDEHEPNGLLKSDIIVDSFFFSRNISRIICGTLRLLEPWDEEEGGAEQEDHHGRARLRLPEAAVDDDLVQPPQLPGQRLVLRLEQLDLLVQLVVLDAAAAHAVLHRVDVLLLSLSRVLSRHLKRRDGVRG